MKRRVLSLLLAVLTMASLTTSASATTMEELEAWRDAFLQSQQEAAAAKAARYNPYETYGDIYGLNVEYPTQGQIALYYQSYDMGQGVSDTFDVTPVTTAPYVAGALTDTTLTHAINTVNYVRYIAGLDWDVTLNDDYNTYAAAGALVNDVNNVMTHYPTQPADMDSTLYSLGIRGASKGNISVGSSNMYSVIVSGWMADNSSQDNLYAVGHRRWILNPSMGATGFGTSGRYRTMYALDTSNTTYSQTSVAWPAQNTPTNVFSSSDPWSYSQSYAISTYLTTTTVTLTRLSDGAVWNFDTSDADATDGYITVSNEGYSSLTGCLIFRPSGVTYSDGDVFNVHIEGGVEANYYVTFFDVTGVTPTTTDYTRTLIPTDPTVSTTPVSTQSTQATPTITTATATPSATNLMVNGETVDVDAYLINDNNYIKLRDLATMVNGTEKNFEVTWNETMGSIEMLSGTSYTAVGGEITQGAGAALTATLSTATIYCDGQLVELTAYTINDNNYFKLRDIMELFDIGVGYDDATATATLDTSASY